MLLLAPLLSELEANVVDLLLECRVTVRIGGAGAGLVYEGDVALLIAAYPNTFERMEA